ncbi:hypothetical protein LOTGIDRAFT_237355 [Lottia gigantea]|uniref:Ig-like domain-containing protein n=1 Tax=Lottia gigantea TaxID=225164 RepID=V4AK02_LOTGI|nr:hypothetical protein LOTGIDRAFT_237355 [Lottia gigantea]ESP04524.1 hypothetical protein LOTGIDRAFT_237355 [Lottia gigantea]
MKSGRLGLCYFTAVPLAQVCRVWYYEIYVELGGNMVEIWQLLVQSVRLPPSISSPRTPQKIYFKRSDNPDTSVQRVLSCEAQGSLPLEIYWRKNGITVEQSKYVKFDVSDGELAITDPTREDEGVYQCIATNKWGTSLSQPFHFIMGRHGSFPDDPVTSLSVNEGDSASLTCDNQPISVPAGTYFWYKQPVNQQGGAQDQVIESDRHAIDKTGTLYFINVIKRDQLIDKVYACGIYNSLDESIKIGSKKRLDVSPPSTGVTNFSPIRLHAPETVEGQIGKDVELECIIGGSPVPTIKWLGLSSLPIKTRNNKYKVTKFGRSLQIFNVTESDEGGYTCIAENNSGRETVFIYFNVTSPPMWINSLQSKHAIVGDDVKFTCKARPAVQEELLSPPDWFINGEPLNMTKELEQGRMMSFNDDRTILTIQDVSRDRDLMCIQCNISNSIGSVFSDAYLNVLEPIMILSRPPEFTVFGHGEVLNFTITATTDPSQTLTRRWFLNDKPLILHQPYFMYDEQSGDFYFNTSKVAVQDIESMAGEYRCELSHQHEITAVAFSIATSKPTTDKNSDPVVAGNYTFIIVIIAGLLVVIIVCIVIVALWKNRTPKAVYNLGKEEDKNFNLTPINQLESEELHNETMNETMNESKLSLYSVGKC